MHYSRTEYTRFSSDECCDVGLSELEAMSVRAGPRLLADHGLLFPYRIGEELPTTRKVARPVNTSAFVGTNPTGEQITYGLPAIRAQSPTRNASFENLD